MSNNPEADTLQHSITGLRAAIRDAERNGRFIPADVLQQIRAANGALDTVAATITGEHRSAHCGNPRHHEGRKLHATITEGRPTLLPMTDPLNDNISRIRINLTRYRRCGLNPSESQPIMHTVQTAAAAINAITHEARFGNWPIRPGYEVE